MSSEESECYHAGVYALPEKHIHTKTLYMSSSEEEGEPKPSSGSEDDHGPPVCLSTCSTAMKAYLVANTQTSPTTYAPHLWSAENGDGVNNYKLSVYSGSNEKISQDIVHFIFGDFPNLETKAQELLTTAGSHNVMDIFDDLDLIKPSMTESEYEKYCSEMAQKYSGHWGLDHIKYIIKTLHAVMRWKDYDDDGGINGMDTLGEQIKQLVRNVLIIIGMQSRGDGLNMSCVRNDDYTRKCRPFMSRPDLVAAVETCHMSIPVLVLEISSGLTPKSLPGRHEVLEREEPDLVPTVAAACNWTQTQANKTLTEKLLIDLMSTAQGFANETILEHGGRRYFMKDVEIFPIVEAKKYLTVPGILIYRDGFIVTKLVTCMSKVLGVLKVNGFSGPKPDMNKFVICKERLAFFGHWRVFSTIAYLLKAMGPLVDD